MPQPRQPDRLQPSLTPQPPPCIRCGSQMRLVCVNPKYTNIDLWSYKCDPCGETIENFVAHKE
jgi:hypothetical protein